MEPLSKKVGLFKDQFYLTLKLVVLGITVALAGFYLGEENVNIVVIAGLIIVTIAPIMSFYIVVRRMKNGNY